MKKLDFKPVKSKKDFRNNYKLHDLAEFHGKNLLQQWGFDFTDFGNDRRFEKVWEKGLDKPDIMAEYKGKNFLIDWKGKNKESFWVNKRAIESYKNWSAKLNNPIIIVFFVFNTNGSLKERKFALVGYHKHSLMETKAWDKNEVVKFENSLPKFTKLNIINNLSAIQ